MTDHLTNAILAAARLDDTEAAKHLGYIVDLDEPHAIAHVTAGRPYLRASMERGGYLHPDHDEASVICLMLRAQHEANPEILYARLARRGFPLLADVAKRSRDALDAQQPAVSVGVIAGAFAFDDPPPQTVVRGATLTTQPITPDDVIPDDIAEWHPYATREEWEVACDETARRLGGPL